MWGGGPLVLELEDTWQPDIDTLWHVPFVHLQPQRQLAGSIGTIPRYKDVRGGEKIQFETRSGLREQTRRSSRRLVNSKGVTFAFTNQLESVSSQRRRSNGGFIPAVDSIRLRWDWDVVGFNDGIWTVTNQAPEIQKLNSKLHRFCTWRELGSYKPTWEFEYCPDIFCSIS